MTALKRSLLPQRIILLGYMGSGKTTVGRALAKDLGMSFYDLDLYIEARMRKTVKQLFDERGEKGFRAIEQKLLHEVAEFEQVVVACGGGTPCFFDNMDYLNQQGETIYLKATPEVLYQHLKMGKTVRPLLLEKTQEETQAFIQTHLSQRSPIYERAKHTLDVNLLNTYEKIQISVNEIKQFLQI